MNSITEELESTVKSTVLVVDDTPENLILMVNLLKDLYKVKVASNGEKALKIALLDPPPDLILLDIMMPGMDGYEVCMRLKQDTRSAKIPVIFVTARAETEDETKGLELGAVDYITKPISPAIVLARVKSHLAHKVLADMLQQKNTELDIAKIVAEKANLAKSEFLSSMSHELRSPLNAILGFAQLMETDTPAPLPSQQESITQILQAGWHLLKLINEILDLAKIESGHITISEEPVSLAEVLLECHAMIEPQAQQRHIQVTLPVFDKPFFVMADRTRLKQVLINLMTNAIKYNREQGSVEADLVFSQPGRLRIRISDTGAGLRADQLGQLFKPFNRLGQEAGGEEGTGIGLVVAKQLVELMGGVIGVESTVGVGSVFWFELNAIATPEELEPEDAAQPDPQGLRIQPKMQTLLYVEDNLANLKLVEQIIARRSDLCLLSAVDGNSGIELARKSLPDIILLDINLPDTTGFEVFNILRADPLTRKIPILAISANAMPLDIQKGLNAGFFRYLTKPIRVNEFMDALNTAMESARQERSRNI